MSYLYMVRGTDREFEVAVQNPDGTALDLTGAVLRWIAKRAKFDSSPIVMDKDSTNIAEIEIPAGTGGVATIFVVGADTQGFTGDERFFWDLYVTKGGDTQRVDHGRLYVEAGLDATP